MSERYYILDTGMLRSMEGQIESLHYCLGWSVLEEVVEAASRDPTFDTIVTVVE